MSKCFNNTSKVEHYLFIFSYAQWYLHYFFILKYCVDIDVCWGHFYETNKNKCVSYNYA